MLENPGIVVNNAQVETYMIDYLNVLYNGNFSNRVGTPPVQVISVKDLTPTDLILAKTGHIAVVGKPDAVQNYYKTALKGYVTDGYMNDNLPELKGSVGDISAMKAKGIAVSGPGVVSVFQGLPKTYDNNQKLALTVLHGLGHNLTENGFSVSDTKIKPNEGHTGAFSKNFMMDGTDIRTWIFNGAANIKYGNYDGSIKQTGDLFKPENTITLLPAFKQGFYSPFDAFGIKW
jgi:hypothetical protein